MFEQFRHSVALLLCIWIRTFCAGAGKSAGVARELIFVTSRFKIEDAQNKTHYQVQRSKSKLRCDSLLRKAR
jgi:diketogulonate reductase-like aldo/keto reductase